MARKIVCMIGSLSLSAAVITPMVSKSVSQKYRLSESETKGLNVNKAIDQARKLIFRLKNEVGAPGIIVGVSVDGKVVWKEGIGYADLENEVEAHEETVMRIASISKSLTAAVVARLWQEGVIDIDKPIQKYVPTYPEKFFSNEKVAITTRQLMCHLSGIRHYSKKKKDDSVATGDGQLEEFYSKERYESVEKALSIFKDDDLLHSPGSKFLYTTYGWTVVSAVMEGATGKTYPQLMRAFLREIGMRRTYLDEPEPIIYGRSKCYSKNKNGQIKNSPYVDNSCKWAGGGFLSTVGDLLKFANAMLFAYQSNSEIDVSRATQSLIEDKIEVGKEIQRTESYPSLSKTDSSVEEKVEKHKESEPSLETAKEETGNQGETGSFSSLRSGANSIMVGIGKGGSYAWEVASSLLGKEKGKTDSSVQEKVEKHKESEPSSETAKEETGNQGESGNQGETGSFSSLRSGANSIMVGIGKGGSYAWEVASSMLSKEKDESPKTEISPQKPSIVKSTVSGIGSITSYIWKQVTFSGDQKNSGSTQESDAVKTEDKNSLMEYLTYWFKPKALDSTEQSMRVSQEQSKTLLVPFPELKISNRFWLDNVLPYATEIISGKIPSDDVDVQFGKPEGCRNKFGSEAVSLNANKPYVFPGTVATLWTRVEGTRLSDWGPHVEGGYGLGFGVASVIDGAGGVADGGQPFIVGHTGGAVGASSAMIIVPRKCHEKPPNGVAVVLLTNLQSVSLNPLAIEIARIFANVVT